MKHWIFIILLSITLRISFCLYLFPTYLLELATIGNIYLFDDYYEIATQLLAGKGYSLADGTNVFHRPPLYSLFLTIPISLAKEPNQIVPLIQIFQSILAGLGVLLAMNITRLLTFKSSRAPLLVGYIIALWPFSVWITKSSIPENLLLILVPLQLLLAIKYLQEKNILTVFLFGVVNGLLCLTHASYLAFSLASFLALIIGLKLKEVLPVIILLLAGFLITLFPWTLRNQTAGYSSVTTATGFGLHYFKGWYYFEQLQERKPYFKNLEAESAKFANNYIQNQGLPTVLNSRDRSNFENMAKIDHLATEHLLQNLKLNYLKLFVKAPAMWIRQQSNSRTILNLILLFPIVLLAWFGIKKLAWQKEILVALPMIALTATMSLVFIEDAPMRYALPIFPLMVILAGVGISDLNSKRHWFKRR